MLISDGVDIKYSKSTEILVLCSKRQWSRHRRGLYSGFTIVESTVCTRCWWRPTMNVVTGASPLPDCSVEVAAYAFYCPCSHVIWSCSILVWSVLLCLVLKFGSLCTVTCTILSGVFWVYLELGSSLWFPFSIMTWHCQSNWSRVSLQTGVSKAEASS